MNFNYKNLLAFLVLLGTFSSFKCAEADVIREETTTSNNTALVGLGSAFAGAATTFGIGYWFFYKKEKEITENLDRCTVKGPILSKHTDLAKLEDGFLDLGEDITIKGDGDHCELDITEAGQARLQLLVGDSSKLAQLESDIKKITAFPKIRLNKYMKSAPKGKLGHFDLYTLIKDVEGMETDKPKTIAAN